MGDPWHNGIIENYKELKATLTEHEFKSETDTEVLAALVESFYQGGAHPLINAVVQALKLVKGTYGIAVVSTKAPDEIVVARAGSPLVIGVGHDETLIASDASALVGHTKQAIYLNDGEVALIHKDSIEIKTLNAEPVSAKVEMIETNLAAIQKGGYEHFLLKEIMEQPESLKETLRGRVNLETGTVRLGGPGLSEEKLRKIKHLVIVGCGTAYHAPTIGIVNAIGSTIAREVDGGTYVHVGPEISVASTKAFTSQMIAMVMFGLTIAQAKGVKPGVLYPYIKEIANLPEMIRKTLDQVHDDVKRVAEAHKEYEHAIYLGRDTAYPAAMEGALKLKEISYVDANAYAFGELKHGPLALIDDRFLEFALVPKGPLFDKAISNVQEVLARGGHVIVVTNTDFDLPVEDVIRIPGEIELFAPMLMNLVSQLFAYYMTVAKGYNVDQPRNLAKSVTVE